MCYIPGVLWGENSDCIPFTQQEESYHETRREGASITIDLRASSAFAPTLAQINSRNARRSTKRVKQDSTVYPTTTTYSKSYYFYLLVSYFS